MFTSLLVLLMILFVTYKVDYRVLTAEKSKKQRIVYCIIYGIGFIGIAIYLFVPVLPNYLGILEGQIKPIGA